MTNTISNINRPPIGFIVEGTGEYNAYPSLVSRILAVNNLHLPIVNSGGCGTIYRNLGRLLSNLILTYHPLNIIVTVDLIDAIKQKMHKNCEELRLALESNRFHHDW